MSDSVWSRLHDNYKEQGLESKSNIFAQTAIEYFPEHGSILELGAGLGQDGRYFAEKGYEVVVTDLETTIIEENRSKAQSSGKITFEVVDLRNELQFKDASFEVVYAHLSLHYFDALKTSEIFEEIQRVLKPGGIVAFLVNSVNDPEFNTGQQLEEEFFEVGNKVKRFFSLDSAKGFTARFETILLDDQGETYKDRAKGVHNLIRYIGRKPAS